MCVKATVVGIEGVISGLTGEFVPYALRLRFHNPEDEQALFDWKEQGKKYPIVIVKVSENQ